MGSKFNASLYAYAMKNRFRDHYGDMVELEHSGTAEPEGRQLSDLEIARRVAFIFHKGQRELEQQRGQPHYPTLQGPKLAGAAAAADR